MAPGVTKEAVVPLLGVVRGEPELCLGCRVVKAVTAKSEVLITQPPIPGLLTDSGHPYYVSETSALPDESKKPDTGRRIELLIHRRNSLIECCFDRQNMGCANATLQAVSKPLRYEMSHRLGSRLTFTIRGTSTQV